LAPAAALAAAAASCEEAALPGLCPAGEVSDAVLELDELFDALADERSCAAEAASVFAPLAGAEGVEAGAAAVVGADGACGCGAGSVGAVEFIRSAKDVSDGVPGCAVGGRE
jgi:hypothetical protein